MIKKANISHVRLLDKGDKRCSMKLVRTWLTMSKPVVTVQQGKLEGAQLKSSLGLSYLAFRGIPFAVPPVGDLRFKVCFRYSNIFS